MTIAVIPSIRDLGTVPNNNMEESVYNTTAEHFTGQMPGWGGDVKAVAEAAKTNAEHANSVASSAAASATYADAQANAAMGYRNEAGNHASAAATHATNAGVSASQAATSNTTLQTYYLGAKASHPTTNNQGGALVLGTTYNNTTDGSGYWWNGASWQKGYGNPATVDFNTQVTGKPSLVNSVNGRSGAVTGLVEAATVLPASTDLDTIKTSGFYRLGVQNAGTYDVSQGQLIVSSDGNVIWQQITPFQNTFILTRTGWADGASWSPWRVVFHDSYVVEKMKVFSGVAGTITPNPYDGSIFWIEPNGNCTITPVAPRAPGDQMTLRLMQRGSYSFAFGSNVKFRAGSTFQAPAIGQMRTLVLTGLYAGDLNWLAYDAGVHNV